MNHSTQPSIDLETQLREMECYIDNTALPQVYIDSDMILRKFTPTALRSFALSHEDEGRPLHELKDHFRFTRIEDDVRSVLASGLSTEKEVHSSDKRWYQMKITPYFNRAGEIQGVMITFIDISDKIRRLKALEVTLEQNEVVLDRISHDIRSPLTNLLLVIEEFTSVDRNNIDKAQKYADIMCRSVRKMQQVINELTDLRKSAALIAEEMTFLDFSRMLDDVYTSLDKDIQTTGATFTYRPEAGRFIYSRLKLRSILYNLISNAIKYRNISRAPEVTIRTVKHENYLLVEVTDNGLGIHQNQQAKVFEKYFRASDSVEGTGVGLYLIKQMVEEDGGWIELESQPGTGSQFRVFLHLGRGPAI